MPALDLPATETAIVEATNAFRAKHNLSALRPNTQLAAAARAYAKSLAARGELTHTANGTTPSSRAQAAGYSYCLIAENLALIYDSRGFTPRSYAKRAQDGWEASPGHRENLMRPGVTETGVGVSGSKPNDPRYVAVQLLGRPAALKFSFALKNTAERAISYSFGGKPHVVHPRETIRYTTCSPEPLAITTDTPAGAVARYEPKTGQVYTLKTRPGGGVSVDIGTGSRRD
jgi:Cysteine-rich secretory protein family